MMRTVFAPKMPQEYVNAVGSLIEHFGWMAPSWCHTLTLDYASDDKDDGRTKAECEAEPHYRQARITVYPRFLELDQAERANTIVHELCHLVIAPLSHAIADILGAAQLSDDARAIAEKMQGDADEAVVEDMAVALARIADIYERDRVADFMVRA